MQLMSHFHASLGRAIALKAIVGIAIMGLPTLINPSPSLAQRQSHQPLGPRTLHAQAHQRPEVKLSLSAAKKVISREANGQTKISWIPVSNGTPVQPGDILRYSLNGKNQGKGVAKNLVLNQPIPAQMAYIEGSVQGNGASPSFSLDRGKTFSPRPMIQVRQADGKLIEQPAPASSYTQIRWTFNQVIQPQATVNVAYDVRVK